MKILTTAVFSVLLMGRRFHARKWRALVLLVLGVTLVSNGSSPGSSAESGDGEGDDVTKAKVTVFQYIIGVAAVLTEVCVCVCARVCALGMGVRGWIRVSSLGCLFGLTSSGYDCHISFSCWCVCLCV